MTATHAKTAPAAWPRATSINGRDYCRREALPTLSPAASGVTRSQPLDNFRGVKPPNEARAFHGHRLLRSGTLPRRNSRTSAG
jgi:hypothetical protein